jgi:hypothetical protein
LRPARITGRPHWSRDFAIDQLRSGRALRSVAIAVLSVEPVVVPVVPAVVPRVVLGVFIVFDDGYVEPDWFIVLDDGYVELGWFVVVFEPWPLVPEAFDPWPLLLEAFEPWPLLPDAFEPCPALELEAPGAPEFEPCDELLLAPELLAPELLDAPELPDCAYAKPIAPASAIVAIDDAMDFIEVMTILLR